MSYATQMIEKARARGRRRGLRSQQVQRNERLAAALDVCLPEDHLVFELATRNPRTGCEHYLEIYHERFGGTDRFSVYVNGERWRNGWSRTRFAEWIFRQIESVRRDWN